MSQKIKTSNIESGAITADLLAPGLSLGGGGGITVYDAIDELPLSGVSDGTLAYVKGDTNRLYLWIGTGWYNIATVNQTPVISGNLANYAFDTQGTPIVVTLSATDPEGIPVTWGYTTNGLGSIATVAQNENIFTLTPSTDENNAGSFLITFTASDGVNVGTANSTFTLEFLSPYWDETVLSIGTSSTNSLDNSTFIDRSTNAHTVTPTGTPLQTAFHPYLDNWSVEIPSGTHAVQAATNAAYVLTDAFTLELWINTSVSSASVMATQIGSSNDYWKMNINSGNLGWNFRNGPTPLTGKGSTVINDGAWHHCAFVRTSGSSTVTTYVDGQSDGTFTWSSTLTQDPIVFGAGLYPGFEEYNFNGYISNVRISDIARYTGSFTPPTENFTSDSNTKLLTFQSNIFVDNSSVGNTFTLTGTPKISAFNPFGQGSEYAVGENKGSLYGGNDEFLIVDVGNATDFGTRDFTVECWFYDTGTSDTYPGLISDADGWESGSAALRFNNQGNRQVGFYRNGIGDPAMIGGSIASYQWNHVAVTRSGSSFALWLNGDRIDTLTSTATINWARYTSEDPKNGLLIGEGFDTSGSYVGYISDVRMIDGTALYDPSNTTYSVPTEPVGNTNASLYLPMDNAGIFDKTGNNLADVIGSDTYTDTSITKYATSSIAFRGVDDNSSGLLIDTPNISGLGDWTIEFWVYHTDVTPGHNLVYIDARNGGASDANTPGLYFNGNLPNYTLGYYVNSGYQIESTNNPFSVNTWYHIAVCRSSGSTKMFIDGSQVGSTYSDTINYVPQPMYIGRRYISTGSAPTYYGTLPGNIENLQILGDVAKYTTNFTPPDRTQDRTYQATS